MRFRALTAAVVLGTLGAGSLASPAFSNSTSGPQVHGIAAITLPPKPPPPPPPPPLTVSLSVANHKPLQLHGVLLTATASSPVAAYFFDYGDGIVESSSQPVALHAYQDTGTFEARVGAVDRSGRRAISAPVTIQVRDGIPPLVSITSPRPDQHVRLGAAGLLLRGLAMDAGGVRRVELAVQLIASAQHFNVAGGCIWYDSRQWLVATDCSTPYFFRAHLHNGHWSFRIDPKARIPAGTYAVRVRARDQAGNVSHYYSVRLRTVLPFELRR